MSIQHRWVNKTLRLVLRSLMAPILGELVIAALLIVLFLPVLHEARLKIMVKI
ncbi:MAG: hypothetical protein H7Z20_10335 [Bdellovibrio sp.]|nr:hypothetical protein [Methylotenera sp.]